MNNILVIAGNEARRIFVSPLAWVVLALFQGVLGYVFWYSLIDFANNSGQFGDSYGVSDYIVGGALVGFPVFIMLLVMPIMTMRLFAEERKNGTITLLFGAPVSLVELVIGKFLGLFTFLLAVIGLIALMCAALLPGTNYQLDLGRVAAGLLGLLLMLSAFGAAGMFVSSLTREPVIAAVASLIVLLLLWLIQLPASMEGMAFAGAFEYLSLISHFDSLRRGIFNSADVVYYVLFTALFLWLTVQRLDMERN